MNRHKPIFLIFALISFTFASCDKGYKVRFTNYSLEPMDSVLVGNNEIVFTNIEIQTVSDYRPLKKGKYAITCISKAKNRYVSSITIPKAGTGNRSIQIDGTNTIDVLEQ